MTAAPALRNETLALTGPAPARTAHELAGVLRRQGLGVEMLAKTAAWLSGERRQSPNTQAGYIRDLSWWLTYAAARGLNPADVDPSEADLYGAALREAGLSNATRARRLSAASSWYNYLVRAGLADRNPFGVGMERPAVAKASTTRGMSEAELETMLAYAKVRESARTYALLTLMVATGARVSSATRTAVDDIGRDSGHAVIDLPTKGHKTKRFVLPPVAVDAVESYLSERGDLAAGTPLFATRTGNPIDQPYVFRLIRRVAQAAGIPQAGQLSPHSIRHSVATILLDKGYPLHVVQDFLGHADPRTTRGYDLGRESLKRSPAYDLGNSLAAGIDRYAPAFAA